MNCPLSRIAALGAIVAGASLPAVAAEQTRIDLTKPDAAKPWLLEDQRAQITDGELVLDGRARMVKAFYLPTAWSDVTLTATFMVEAAPQGVLACGFVVRARDADHAYYVHYDRGQAILCRSNKNKAWIELKRVSGLDKPAGTWHEGKLEAVGDTLRVHLNGKLLYEAKDTHLDAGRIGFYANQGRAHVKDIVVTGKGQPAKGEIKLPPPPWIHVCTDAGAGAYEAFPDVCRLNDGRLMSVFYAGYGHVALPNEQLPKGGRVAYCVSSDEGRTWSPAKTLYDGPDDDRDPSIVQLDNGKLICNFFSLRKAPGKKPPWDGLGSWMVTSTDMGKTWSRPKQIAKDYYCSSPIRRLSDGRLILGLYAEQDGKGWGAVTLSDDDGETWSPVIDIDNAGMRLDAETDIIELKDGSLYAAQRGRDETMGWAISKDRGKTWTVSKPMGFPGHCPYLLRAVNDVIFMAHRLPKTSLHYSLDECKTWSKNVPVDSVIGAYPSMVNLRDGTVLIVYYEEGAGSSIRAKRFLPTRKGPTWMPVDQGPIPPATLVSCRMIWDKAPHNAFTNLMRHEGKWYCVFREGQGHAKGHGALRVIASTDGEAWQSLARVTCEGKDLRDAQISVTPKGELMLSGAAMTVVDGERHFQSMAFFSSDGGKTWSNGVEIGDPNVWLWRVTWHEGKAYGIGYSTAKKKFIRLYTSTDGRTYDTLVKDLGIDKYPNETKLLFLADETCLCLLRRGGTGLLGKAKPPYTEWTWKDLGAPIGGPNMIRLPDGRFVAAVRLYDKPVRTGLCWVDPEAGTLTEFMTLPSGGDTSYPGMVWHEGLLWVSYYTSHEGKTSIYLAKVRFD